MLTPRHSACNPHHVFASMPRLGLVVGAGGPVGVAFHAGVLRAIEKVTGWDARTADVIIGTSAGAQVGALLRAELCVEDLSAYVMGWPLTPGGASVVRHYVRPLHHPPHSDHPLRLVPSSSRYLLRVMRDPRRLRLGPLLASMLPPGRVALNAQAEGFRRLFGNVWPEKKLWIPALCLDTGELAVFGRPEAPATDVGSAVTASGSVPGLCVPVGVGGRRYVDGCFLSFTHLAIVAGSGLDAVLVSSPLSRFGLVRGMVRRSVRKVRARGLPVLLIEPSRQTIAAMGWNPFDMQRTAAVAQSAFRSTVALLEQPGQAEMRRRLEAAR